MAALMKDSGQPAVYIMASKRNGTLYIGVTSDLVQRVAQHRSGLIKGFTSDYGVNRLVCYQIGASMEEAIMREKRLKKWNRKWKLELIESSNSDWRDLAVDIGFEPLHEQRLDSRFRGNDGEL
ncbi:GIY-YIG nuclease family protein [Sphingobium sp. DEHP117]|uniref:GIY-YIG nuclease family protein n=1 Tax=Sphingobium sp. DEHP117 TaxID=2993436 RepID=UPI0027D5A6C2|nr:GIY-YIG nuclease family protein [Sphingobium sp. DEHP117]MDQ4420790.1 GIY-YIG nuclease family protein [Sphingobium sp. DEHP117]